MGVTPLYNDNLRKLPNEYGGFSVMQVVFLGISRFRPILRLTQLKNEWNNLDGPLNPNKKEEDLFMILFDGDALCADVLMFQKRHTVRCRRKW